MAFVQGTQFDDQDFSLEGTAGDDTIEGLGGNDWLIATTGADRLDGGSGFDVVFYDVSSSFTSGVFINNSDSAVDGLAAQRVDTRGFGVQTLIGIESLHGSRWDDVIYMGLEDRGTYSLDFGGDDLVVVQQISDEFGHRFVSGPGDDTYVGGLSEYDEIFFGQVFDYDGNAFQGALVTYTGFGAGTIIDPWGDVDTFTGVEQITGSDFGDTLTGGPGENYLAGMAGDDDIDGGDGRDDLAGGPGADTLDGGAGDEDEIAYQNEAYFEEAFRGVFADLDSGIAVDPFGDVDTLLRIERLEGTFRDDTLNGDDADNRLRGHEGDDVLRGRDGNDRLRPGLGEDTVEGGDGDRDRIEYNDADGAISVTFTSVSAGTATDWGGDTDTFSEIERADGGDFDDTLTGAEGMQRLRGGEGDDLISGRGGDDLVVGGEGDDTLNGDSGEDYFEPGSGVDVIDGGDDEDTIAYLDDDDAATGVEAIWTSATGGTATDWAGDTDSFTNVERVRGTNFDDTLTGAEGRQRLSGEGGDDVLSGGGGDDGITGDAGDDTLNGGAGEDYIEPGSGTDSVDGGEGQDTIVYFHDDEAATGVEVVWTSATGGTATDWAGDTDTFTGVEEVRATDFDDTLIGADGEQILQGAGGDDLMAGGGGNDRFIPGLGEDTIDGGAGDEDELNYDYGDATAGITVTFTTDTGGTVIDYGGDTDTFDGIERITATPFDDVITVSDPDDTGRKGINLRGGDDMLTLGSGDDWANGNTGDDTILGGAGGDWLRPGSGDDSIDGGANGALGEVDYLVYEDGGYEDDATGGVTVTFTSETGGTATDWSGGTDVFTNIEAIRGSDFGDSLTGAEGKQRFQPGAGADTIDGGAGDEDQVEYYGSISDGGTQGIVVTMADGTIIDPWGDTETISSIERIAGTELGDRMTGSDADERFSGQQGDDTLDGGLGRNSLDGREGNDVITARGDGDFVSAGDGNDSITVIGSAQVRPGLGNDTIIGNAGEFSLSISYIDVNLSVTADLASGQAILAEGGGTDSFTNAYALQGGFGADTLRGGDRDYEQFNTSPGNDVIDGRGGEVDYLSYGRGEEVDGITATFTSVGAGTVSSTYTGTDSFTNINGVRGFNFDDTFTGSSGGEFFSPMGGDDDVNGGDGQDAVEYWVDVFYGAEDGVAVDLSSGEALDPWGGTDSLTSIEDITATPFDDTLTGDGGANLIDAGGGDDTVIAGAGDDEVRPGEGTDEITLGTGADRLVGTAEDLDGVTLTDFAAEDAIAVWDADETVIGANISITGNQMEIDTDGDGAAEATLTLTNGYSGPVTSEGGSVGGAEPARIGFAKAGFFETVTEGDSGTTKVSVTLERSGGLSDAVSVVLTPDGFGSNPVTSTDISAALGLPVTLEFAANQTSLTYSFDIVGDTALEASEDLSLTLSDATSQGGLAPEVVGAQTYIRIANDDVPSLVDIFGGRASESAGSLPFTLRRDGATDGEMVVTIALSGGSDQRDAQSDDVQGALPRVETVTIPDGAAETIFSLGIIDDDVPELHNYVYARILSISGPGAVGYDFNAALTTGDIRNDDGFPELPIGRGGSSAADPHLVTLDGLAYDFMAVGEYTLVEAQSGTPYQVQVRYQPVAGSDIASQTTAMATDLGGVALMVDIEGDSLILANGAPIDLDSLSGGAAIGTGTVYFDGETITIVHANGEQTHVALRDGFIDVAVYVLDGRDVAGLLGNGNGDATDDLALRDGTVLSQPVAFDDLYGAFAEDWRIDAATSLFTYAPGGGPDDYLIEGFPVGRLDLADVPDSVLQQAEAATAHIENAAQREAAILDFVLTGNESFIDAVSEQDIAPSTETAPEDAPMIAAGLGVLATVDSLVEGDSDRQDLSFTIYRTGAAEGELSVDWSVGGEVDADDIASALSGSVTLGDSMSRALVPVALAGDLDFEADETLVFSIDPAGDLIRLSSQAEVLILNDDADPSERLGTGEDDTFAARAGFDRYFTLSGTDDVRGSLPSLDGDVIADFAPGDRISVLEAGLRPSDVSVTSGSAVVNFAGGAAITLDGDYADMNFVVETDADGATISLAGAGDTMLSVAGERFVTTGAEANRIFGDTGDDLILAAGGADTLIGSDGSDVLLGGAGADHLAGGAGSDVLTGGAGADRFVATAADNTDFAVDTITDFQPGLDRLELQGVDLTSLQSVAGDDGVLIGVGAGFVALEGLSFEDLAEGDIVTGTAETALIATTALHRLSDSADRFVTTDAGGNRIFAGADDDSILSADGADRIDGGTGSDFLIAGGGDDTVIGGSGNDVMRGGAGADRFIFRSGEESDFIVDTLLDVTDEDRIVLEGDHPALSITSLQGSGAVVLGTHFIVVEGWTEAELAASDLFEFV